jgi:hypothetical protein
MVLGQRNCMPTVSSYLQCLYRLVANPFSSKQALDMLAVNKLKQKIRSLFHFYIYIEVYIFNLMLYFFF